MHINRTSDFDPADTGNNPDRQPDAIVELRKFSISLTSTLKLG